ncbi:DUF6220 domain-containing protein [Paenibacillus terrigena]|uniref:DUF6220 domain-containing protein n=1 Tax=Paenibacillus terrigena TaxID=369333 RepID=UPI0003687DE2|nr:DUF6220 domain-containing protein [Paenibacillus terrigena]
MDGMDLCDCILLQVFLAGLSLFWESSYWASHQAFSRVVTILPLLMLVTSFIARLPVSIRLRSAGLVGMIILMAVTANLSSGVAYLSALHPVIAVVLFLETVSIARKASTLTKVD